MVRPYARFLAGRRGLTQLGLACCLAFGPVGAPCALAAAAGSAVADAPSVDAPEVAPQVEADPVVCRRIKVIGSHMRQRICRKKSEWRAMREDAQQLLNRKLPNTRSSEG